MVIRNLFYITQKYCDDGNQSYMIIIMKNKLQTVVATLTSALQGTTVCG